MIVRILLLILLLIVSSAILFFIYGIFIPAIKEQIVKNQDPLFAEVELNYTDYQNDDNIVTSNNRAFVIYRDKSNSKANRFNYNGIHNCALFNSIFDSQREYSFGCIGFGDCIKVCQQNAIKIKNGIAIITSNCCGCGKCVDVCPKNIIKLYDKNTTKQITVFNSKGETSTFQLDAKDAIPEQKYFKFWKSYYRIFKRK